MIRLQDISNATDIVKDVIELVVYNAVANIVY